MLKPRYATPLALCLAFASAACDVRTPDAPNTADLPDAGSDGVYTVEFPEPAPAETRHLLMTVSEDLSTHCKEMPHFPFDEAKPRAQARVKLAFVTQCLKTDELADLQVFVVGHADRRGDVEYNLDLALRRAQEVRDMLVKQGVSADRLRIGTMGESAAVGGEGSAFSHGYDRRVDIVVLGKDAAPEESGVVPYIPTDAS